MKTNTSRKRKIAEDSKKQGGSPVCAGVEKSTKKHRQPHERATGSLPLTAAQVLDQQLPSRSESFAEKTKQVLGLELENEQVHPSTKIKLQLFPIDECTRRGLAKDGHNPHLELTLRARKKISSVLTHINTKWGSSSIALGEPMLFPYNVSLTTGRRWTLKDTRTSAGDVYATLETPPIFRLRYGWFSDCEPQGVPVASTSFDSLGSESMQKGCNTISMLRYVGGEQTEVTDKKNLIDASKRADAVVIEQGSLDVPVECVNAVVMGNDAVQSIGLRSDIKTNLSIGELLPEVLLQGKMDAHDLKSNWSRSDLLPIPSVTEISIGGLLSEASLQGKLNNNELVSNGSELGIEQSPFLWDDGLTALSIGGLLSEASLQHRINNSDPTSNGTKSVVQPLALISDSFDAIIAAQMNSHPQVATKPSSYDSRSSILDAEETCHEFSFRKFSSAVGHSGRSSNNSSSNSFKFPKLSKNIRAGFAEDSQFQESKTELLPQSQVFNEDSRSFGLRGIHWNDSLGPFDLGLSTVRPVTGGG